MQRRTVSYAALLVFFISSEAFAADGQERTDISDNPGASQQVRPVRPGKASTQASPAHKAQDAMALEESIEVRARRSSTTASSATKSDTPLVETAQSVTVITRNEMDVRGVLNLNQAVRYAAGITADTRGGEGTRYDLFDLRGFTVPTFLDGLKVQGSPNGFAVPQTDTSRLERVELLKGPASSLYGQSSPGGLTALFSKLPTSRQFYGDINTTGGMFDLYRVDADVGGFASKDGNVRYRLYGTVNGQHSQLARTGSRRFSISPAFTFGGEGPTTLTLLGNYQYDPENGSYGAVPLYGSLRRATYGYLPRNFYDGDVPSEKYNRRQGSITYILNHRFNEDWSFSTRGRYDDIMTNYRSVYTNGDYDSDDGRSGEMLARNAYGAREHSHNLAFDSQFKGHVSTGPFHHALMFGVDYMQQHAHDQEASGNAPDLDVLHPNYHLGILGPLTPSQDNVARWNQVGTYGQDEIRWKRLILTGSLRNDWYHSRQLEYLSQSDTRQSARQITWRASGLYHFDFGLAPYISYSTSFQPQVGAVSTNGGLTQRQANPSTGKQLEGGMKYQLPGTPVLLSAAGFHIEQSHVLVAVPNTGYSLESGLVHSDGFEFEAHVDVYRNLMMTAAVGFQNVHDDSTGKPLVQSSKGNASLFAFYTLPSGALKGLGFGGGMRYSSKIYGGESAQGSVWLPQYALFDGSVSYDLSNLSRSLQGWKASASVRNIFDRHYIANCFAGTSGGEGSCYFGERRNAQASIGYSW
ncbi:TonB-dependent siderophore receptor [Acetobacter fabarum]|uniref:TonB-dependent siderophore receptor n=1 Tax=Acetobacter fabarum TaxID=483199 RepID=UPI00312BA42B